MFSLGVIAKMNREATARAKNGGRRPYVAKRDEDEGVRNMPKLGGHIPKGYRLVKTYFVDSSGWGSPSEPALTFGQFLHEVKHGHGYGLGEEGQFQVYVHEFEKIARKDVYPSEGRIESV